MASFNKVILLGNLTRDPQLRYLPSQTPVVEFGLAASRKFRTQSGENREETTFVDCSAFGRVAEIINQYCQKGNMLFVEGRLRYEQWEDKQGGGKRSKLSVMVENVQLMPRRDGSGGGGGGFEQDAPSRPQRQPGRPMGGAPVPAPDIEPPISGEQQFSDDDIPF